MPPACGSAPAAFLATSVTRALAGRPSNHLVYPGQEYSWFTPYQEIVEATGGHFAGIRAYVKDAPTPHWHLVTFGLSDLGDKDSPDPELSGYGFELTCRIPLVATRAGFLGLRKELPSAPPDWAFAVLAHLVAYVFEQKTYFEEGHNLNLLGPIDGKGPLRFVVFAQDPLLSSIGTPNGRVSFLQVVGLHADEAEALKSWNSEPFLEILREQNPLLLTDPTRVSLLAKPAIAKRIQAGIERDGSSSAGTFGETVGWVRLGATPRVEVTLDANVASQLQAAIPRMLRAGKPFICMGNPDFPNTTVVFVRAERGAWLVDERQEARAALVVQLADDFLATFEASLTAPAVLEWPDLPNLKLRILPPVV